MIQVPRYQNLARGISKGLKVGVIQKICFRYSNMGPPLQIGASVFFINSTMQCISWSPLKTLHIISYHLIFNIAGCYSVLRHIIKFKIRYTLRNRMTMLMHGYILCFSALLQAKCKTSHIVSIVFGNVKS